MKLFGVFYTRSDYKFYCSKAVGQCFLMALNKQDEHLTFLKDLNS